MRLAPLVAVAIVTSASADPVAMGSQIARTRVPSAEKRKEAATRLANLVVQDRGGARDAVLTAVLTDDAVVRDLLTKAMIDAGMLTAPAAARIPTLNVIDTQLRMFSALDPLPPATSCRVVDADPRGTTLVCHGSACKPGCVHVRSEVRVRAETRWRVLSQARTSNDDGACGHCE